MSIEGNSHALAEESGKLTEFENRVGADDIKLKNLHASSEVLTARGSRNYKANFVYDENLPLRYDEKTGTYNAYTVKSNLPLEKLTAPGRRSRTNDKRNCATTV
ncbi:MAG: hypothetical protein FWE20_08370 [Defluviitaleaceae bacterium]|nr:hypothetical protein [Defluviitaleaceae bacterium]